MAKIEFTGWVSTWSPTVETHPAWGMKVAEAHGSKESPETNTRTYHSIKVSKASGIDLTNFSLDDRVTVTGNQKTEYYELNGEQRRAVVVWADSVTLAPSTKPVTADAQIPSFPAVDDSTPF